MIFNINFFLFCFAQSNIWSYTFVYAKHYANVSNVQWGAMAMILPGLVLVTKPIVCSLTDASGTHKQFLVASLAVFGLSYGSLGILPFFKDINDHSTDGITWIIISVIFCFGSASCASVFCMNDALASNYARKHNLSYAKMRIFACAGYASGALLIMAIGNVSWLPFRVLGCGVLALFILIDITVLLLWPYHEDFEMFHDGSTVEQRKLSIVGPNTLALIARSKPRGSISRDMLERIKAGRSKSVGGVPRMEHPKLNSMSIDNLKKGPKKEYSNFQCQMMLLKMIAKGHKSFIKYVILFTLFGVIQGIIWNYQLDFFKQRIVHDDSEFEFISTFCMVTQAFLGEILINFVANEMIRIFGANANLSLAFCTIGMRCFFYSNVLPYTGIYSVAISEALQGPSLGIYWVLAVDVGSNFALMVPDYMPELKRLGVIRDRRHEEELSGCLRATMIGIMTSSMEGLGVAIGALVGGMISTSLGYDAMWNMCALASVSIGVSNFGWDILTKIVMKKSSDKKKAVESNNNIPTVIVDTPPSYLTVPTDTRL